MIYEFTRKRFTNSHANTQQDLRIHTQTKSSTMDVESGNIRLLRFVIFGHDAFCTNIPQKKKRTTRESQRDQGFVRLALTITSSTY